MSFFMGNKSHTNTHDSENGGSQGHAQGPGQCQCNHNHGQTAHKEQNYSLGAGGALGMGSSSGGSSPPTTVSQPGTEMMPMSRAALAAVGGSPGEAVASLLRGTPGEIQEKLKRAPPNVMAAAQRLSLIPPTQGGVVMTAPGLDDTDTGALSEATLASQLLVAVRTRDLQAVKRLCTTKSERLEAALKRRDGQGHTLMHWAAKAGDVDMLETLAEHGAPTREYSDEAVGMAPLHWAATEGRLRASAWLLGPGGADPEGRDNQVGGDGGFPVLVSRIMSNETGCTALVIAAQYGFVELVIFLSNHGCDLGSVDNVGDSALHWAAYKGHVQVLSMLVKAGQDPEAEDSYGQTPLHLAALRGNLDAAEYLVMEARANLNARDKKNETPLELALKKKQARYYIENPAVSKKKQAAMELFLRTSGAGRSWASPSVFFTVLSTPRIWRAACETGEGVQGASWPLVLNLSAMAFVGWILVRRFCSEEYILLEHSSLLTAAIVSQFLMWTMFLVTWMSNPGYVDPTDPSLSGGFHARIGVLSGKTENKDIGVSIASSSRDELEGAMQSLLGLESAQDALSRPACYTCAVEQPMRSRHCRTCRRCVRAFDHHCPFVGNCVGAGNYRWFFLYIMCLDVSAVLYVALCVDWSWHLGFSLVVLVSGVYSAFFGFFCIGLLLYHTQLVRSNLTTNEHRHMGRVDYLLDPNQSGQYFNPFDKGCAGNCVSRFRGTHDRPPAELEARLRGGETLDVEMASFV